MRVIGVLGGMGVEATITMMQRVHDRTEAADDADHVPMIVALNPQVPSRIRYLIEKVGPDPGPVLADMAEMLERSGAEALVMPCNTAHFFADHIAQRVNIKLINMPQLACAQLAGQLPKGATVGILASPATNATGLFGMMLSDLGLKAIFPEDEAPMLASIRNIKKNGAQDADIVLLRAASADLVRRGATAIMVGCSEFSLLSDAIQPSVPIIDTLDVLVEEIIAFSGARSK